MSSHQSVDPLIGRLVDGRYRVRARIARGGMATVYVATDLRLERRIALKVMHSHLSDDSVFQSRFIQEARAAARLADPNVVNVFDQGQDGELAYLVMEYLPGITLRELLKEQRRLSITQTVTVMDAILSGLAAAHRAGIVHRDVKPENVLLAEDGRIKIGDFGLARATTANTATGQQLMGTIAYLAPELVTRGTADARSDIYALGIMMYEMLTGEQPYRGEQPMQIAFQHATESVPRPSVKNPGVPEQLDELVLWSTERDPEERPLDAEVMLERLREIERELGITPQITRTEPAISAVTAGLAIPEHMTTGGLTAVMPMETPEPVTPAPQADPSDNATKLRQVEQHGKRRGAWLVALTLILALVAGTAGWYFGTGPGSRIAVADVSDTPAAEALAVLRKQSFHVTEKKEPNLTIAAGNAVRTDPEAGERLDRDAAVSLYISTGPAVADLQSFRGRTENDTQKVLEAEHIKISGTVRQFDDKVASGGMIAIAITPRGGGDAVDCIGGCSVHQGDTAAIVVSSGSVPAVNGKGIDEARKLLGDAGLVVADKTIADFRADPGKDRVTGVSGPDRAWREKDTVTLHVSLGPVPSVRDLSQDDARSRLSGVGLKINGDVDEQFSDEIAKGKVIGIHDRDGGGNWRPGDTVTLIVSKGQDLVAVPDVSNMSIRKAMKTLSDAGFKTAPGPLLPSEIYWGLLPAGKTDPAIGTMVKRGSTVAVLGPAA